MPPPPSRIGLIWPTHLWFRVWHSQLSLFSPLLTLFSPIFTYSHLLPHSAPSWILSPAENLASSSLQDGATNWYYFLSKPASRQPDHLNFWPEGKSPHVSTFTWCILGVVRVTKRYLEGVWKVSVCVWKVSNTASNSQPWCGNIVTLGPTWNSN